MNYVQRQQSWGPTKGWRHGRASQWASKMVSKAMRLRPLWNCQMRQLRLLLVLSKGRNDFGPAALWAFLLWNSIISACERGLATIRTGVGAIAPNLIAFHISGEVKIELDQSHLTAMAGITCALGCICHDLGWQDEVLWKSKSGRAELAD